MPDLPRSHLAVYAVAFVAIALLGARQLARGSASGEGKAVAREPAATISVDAGEGAPEGVVVHVAGAVRRPGVYRMRAGERVDDVVRRAGGPTRRADLDGLNLAAEVQDGRQIVVPRRGGGGEPAEQAAGDGADAAAGGGPVNLNTATLAELDSLDGIGPGLAQKILDFRAARGGFTSVEELGDVEGIGEKRLASLRAQVTL